MRDLRCFAPDPSTTALVKAPWIHLPAQAIGAARKVPTMLGAEEQRLYHWLTAEWAEGTGDVVDLGCFAGGSTARLAEGHRVGRLRSTIHAYDRFTADEAAKEGTLYAQGIPHFEGNDILPLARRLLGPWGNRVLLHRGEIDRMRWKGGPIELLVMDASKSAETADQMARTFFPHLIPGRSLVVQQDFLHWSQPWIPVQMELLPLHFTPLVHVPRNTIVYLCERAPDTRTLDATRTSRMTDDLLLAYLERSYRRFAPWGLGDRIEDTIRSLRANEGRRKAFQFRRP